MPKRSDRAVYGDAFETNPFAGLSPRAMYRKIQWDKSPEATWEIDAPEPLVAMGSLAKMVLTTGTVWDWDEDSAPFLAVGRDSNRVYILPTDEHGVPPEVVYPFSPADCRKLGRVVQTDYYSDKGNQAAYYYYSDKGNQAAYYYHEHEAPYPAVWECPETGVLYLVPARHRGRRSYAVAKEGIVG